MKIRLIGAATAGCMALILSIPAHAQSDCIKQVFNKYCLGGSIQPLLSTPPVRTSEKSGATLYVFADGAEQTNVTVVKGRIESVWRRYPPGTQQTFDMLSSELRKLYGEPQRTGTGTPGVTQGGRVTERWDRDGWRVLLVWTNSNDVQLVYHHEALQATRRDAKKAAGSGTGASPSTPSNPRGY
jgi:hypothetical protein